MDAPLPHRRAPPRGDDVLLHGRRPLTTRPAGSPDVAVVGAGLAGLRCAIELERRGLDVLLLEASDAPGGRVRTDEVDGFLLDRGFQVFLTSYPEAAEILDYDALRLRPFLPGARVRKDGSFHELADPWRRPVAALKGVGSPVGSFLDKARVGRLRSELIDRDPADLFGAPDRSTRQLLREKGFSPKIVDAFFRPFLGGVFLDPDLVTSRRMFDFVFRMFSTGEATLPAAGMEAIPRQLAGRLAEGTLRTDARVHRVEPEGVELDGGETIRARAVVVATGGSVAADLLEEEGPIERPAFVGTRCLYFDAPDDPVGSPILVLDGEAGGPVNNLAVPSRVARRYAPEGRTLVSVTVLDGPAAHASRRDGSVPTGSEPSAGTAGHPDPLLEAVTEQLRGWFGAGVDGWRHLRTYRIERALPAQPVGWLDPPRRPVRVGGCWVCGDHRDDASINGALQSGRRCAEAVAEALGG